MILCASNTLHKPLEVAIKGIVTPMIHIADSTGEAMQAAGLSRVALFGTRPVMRMDYLGARWRDRYGIEVIAPTEPEQEEIDRIIFDKLVKGVVADASRAMCRDRAADAG